MRFVLAKYVNDLYRMPDLGKSIFGAVMNACDYFCEKNQIKFVGITLGTFYYIPGGCFNRSFSRPPPPLRCLTKSPKSAHAHWVVGK
jgi:hypothetical protein